jgi:hypothetical protein
LNRELVSGELGWWARTTWANIVTGNDGSKVAMNHHGRGVELRAKIWSDRQAEFGDPASLAWYLARDLGKGRQKTPPKGFGRVRPWWEYEDMKAPEPIVEQIDYLTFKRMFLRMEAWNRTNELPIPRRMDFGGITSPMMRGEEGLRWLIEIESRGAA